MIKIKVKCCARCGEDHEVEFNEFTRLAVDDFNYWGICPNSGEPILMKITNTDDKNKKCVIRAEYMDTREQNDAEEGQEHCKSHDGEWSMGETRKRKMPTRKRTMPKWATVST